MTGSWEQSCSVQSRRTSYAAMSQSVFSIFWSIWKSRDIPWNTSLREIYPFRSKQYFSYTFLCKSCHFLFSLKWQALSFTYSSKPIFPKGVVYCTGKPLTSSFFQYSKLQWFVILLECHIREKMSVTKMCNDVKVEHQQPVCLRSV